MNNSIANLDDPFAFWLQKALNALLKLHPNAPRDALAHAVAEPPRNPEHGHVALNCALLAAKPLNLNPMSLAETLAKNLAQLPLVASAVAAKPGFVNLTFSPTHHHNQIKQILKRNRSYGTLNPINKRRVQVEYVSANPTGPLHVGHMRGAVYGDAIASVLQAAGRSVSREYYVNDAGSQIDALAHAVLSRWKLIQKLIPALPANMEYPGKYLQPVAQRLAAKHGNPPKNNAAALRIARKAALHDMLAVIKNDLKALRVSQESFRHESDLVSQIAPQLQSLKKQNLVYVGTLQPPKGKAPPDDWEPHPQTLFRSTEFGDDVDRPLAKSDGSHTYFAADVAYHHDKISRGFDALCVVVGADHAGYVKRLQAVVAALSNNKIPLDVRVCRLVNLTENGKPVAMSKRAGSYVTLRDVVKHVGADAARFLMLHRRPDVPMNFDLTFAKQHANENPVFYVQYACARCRSVIQRTKNIAFPHKKLTPSALAKINLSPLNHPAEIALADVASRYPRILAAAAKHREPHRIAFFLHDVAEKLHSLWAFGSDHPAQRIIIPKEPQITLAHLALIRAALVVLTNGLELLGVKVPKSLVKTEHKPHAQLPRHNHNVKHKMTRKPFLFLLASSFLASIVGGFMLSSLRYDFPKLSFAQSPPDPHLVQLAAYRSRNDALRGFLILQKQRPKLLGALTPRITPINPQNPSSLLALLVGPFPSKNQAVELCNRLKSQKQDCLVRSPQSHKTPQKAPPKIQ